MWFGYLCSSLMWSTYLSRDLLWKESFCFPNYIYYYAGRPEVFATKMTIPIKYCRIEEEIFVMREFYIMKEKKHTIFSVSQLHQYLYEFNMSN